MKIECVILFKLNLFFFLLNKTTTVMSNDTFLLQDACDHCNLIFEDLSLYSDHDIISLAKGEDLEDSPP